MAGRQLFVAPRDPAAEPICLLTRDWAARRRVQVEDLLDEAVVQASLPDGIEYGFAPRPGIWEQVRIFIEEEGECCPFLEFEARESDEGLVLRIRQPQGDGR